MQKSVDGWKRIANLIELKNQFMCGCDRVEEMVEVSAMTKMIGPLETLCEHFRTRNGRKEEKS